MKTTLNAGKFALAALLGSLLWAGCASNNGQKPALLEQTMDLQNTGPNTAERLQADPFRDAVNLQPWDAEAIQ